MVLESENPKLKSQVCYTSSCMILVKSLNLSESQISSMWLEHGNHTYFIGI